MIRTGLFGGSFNPIHNGHIHLARTFLREACLDEVWLMVSPQNPLKAQADLLDDEKRMEMARLALRDEPGLRASDYEFRLPRPSYTFNTLRALAADEPHRSLVLLVGGDNWARFPLWYRYEDILAQYPIYVYPREGAGIDGSHLPPSVHLLETQLMNVSSTDIRCRIREGKPIAHLVPKQVCEMIERERLYLDADSNYHVCEC